MKNLKFTVDGLFDKILTREKILTIRGLFIPAYKIGETIQLQEVLEKRGPRDYVIGRRALATVMMVQPIQLKNITNAIAEREGFKNAEESKAWLAERYNCADNPGRWFFVIGWSGATVEKNLLDYLPVKTVDEKTIKN